MTFVTSYYAKINEIRKQYPDYILVSISGGITPEILDSVDIHDKRLAPNLSLFKEYKDNPENPNREQQYINRFKKEVLEQRDLNEIFKSWSDKIGLNKKYVIMCYEANEYGSSSFCHRRIVAEEISKKYGIEVPELFLDYENYEVKNYKVKEKFGIDDNEW
jgi:hypothetical protein